MTRALLAFALAVACIVGSTAAAIGRPLPCERHHVNGGVR